MENKKKKEEETSTIDIGDKVFTKEEQEEIEELEYIIAKSMEKLALLKETPNLAAIHTNQRGDTKTHFSLDFVFNGEVEDKESNIVNQYTAFCTDRTFLIGTTNFAETYKDVMSRSIGIE